MTKLKILKLLSDTSMKPKEIAKEIGMKDGYAHIHDLRDMGLIERMVEHCTRYSITDAGIEYLKAGDYSEIQPPTLYVDSLTSYMAEHDVPMTARELHAALQDPRNMYDFRSWLSHLIIRKYLIADKTLRPCTYSITKRGREHAKNPAAYRSQRNHMQFK